MEVGGLGLLSPAAFLKRGWRNYTPNNFYTFQPRNYTCTGLCKRSITQSFRMENTCRITESSHIISHNVMKSSHKHRCKRGDALGCFLVRNFFQPLSTPAQHSSEKVQNPSYARPETKAKEHAAPGYAEGLEPCMEELGPLLIHLRHLT